MSPPLNGRRRRPATWPNMVRWWCMTRAQYMMLGGDRRGPGGPVAHQDPPKVVRVADCCQNRAWIRGFRQWTAAGNGSICAAPSPPSWFLQGGCLTRWDGAPELPGEAHGNLQQWWPATTRARVLEAARRTQEKRRSGCLGFPVAAESFL
jgi:hypothetical protein